MSLFVDLNRVFCTKDEAGNKHFRSFNDDETIIGNQFNINKEIKFHYSRTNTTDCNGYIQIGDDDHRIIIGIVEAESVNHIILKDNFTEDIWRYGLSNLNDSNSFDISLKIEFDTQDIESLQLGDTLHYYFRLTINGKKLNYSAQVSFIPDEAKIFLNRNYISKVVQDANARITDLTFSTDGVYVEKAFLADLIYPIGSIYMSVNSTSPATLFGGTWEQLKDRFLLGSGDIYTNDTTGGSATVTLTSAQSGVPAHNHTYAHTDTTYKANTTSRKPGTSTAVNYVTSITATANNTTKTSNDNTTANASESHENMPPYLTVYMWKRTA